MRSRPGRRSDCVRAERATLSVFPDDPASLLVESARDEAHEKVQSPVETRDRHGRSAAVGVMRWKTPWLPGVSREGF